MDIIYLQPAIILQQRPYRETSLLLDVFTQDHGIIPMLAKGVRKEKSKLAGLLQPFSLLKITYLDKNALKILNVAEWVQTYPLQKIALYSGFYINELLQRFLHPHDPFPELFLHYQHCLLKMSLTEEIEEALRYFELELLNRVGFGIDLEVYLTKNNHLDIEINYSYTPEHGMIVSDNGQIKGQTLYLLANKQPLTIDALKQAKLLLRQILDSHLGHKPLKSRAVLTTLFKYL